MKRVLWWCVEMVVTVMLSLLVLSVLGAGQSASATGDEGVRSMHALESIAHSLERCPR